MTKDFKIKPSQIHPELRWIAPWLRQMVPADKPGIVKLVSQSSRLVPDVTEKAIRFRLIQFPTSSDTARICLYEARYPGSDRNSHSSQSSGNAQHRAKDKNGRPVIFWIHGGGFAMGKPAQDYLLIRRFVLETGALVIAPDYTLSTQKPYPAALDDTKQLVYSV